MFSSFFFLLSSLLLSLQIEGALPANDGVKLVLAMSILGWLESLVMLLITCLALYNIAGIREKLEKMENRHHVVMGIDCALAWLTLIALTVCPTEMLVQDRRAAAAAVFLMLYLMMLIVSILMSYKDVVKQKLIRQGWVPPAKSPQQVIATSPSEIVIE